MLGERTIQRFISKITRLHKVSIIGRHHFARQQTPKLKFHAAYLENQSSLPSVSLHPTKSSPLQLQKQATGIPFLEFFHCCRRWPGHVSNWSTRFSSRQCENCFSSTAQRAADTPKGVNFSSSLWLLQRQARNGRRARKVLKFSSFYL